MLIYSFAPTEEQKLIPVVLSHVTFNRDVGISAFSYDPSIEEFSVIKTQLDAIGAQATFEDISGPTIIVCTAGEATISVGSATKESVKKGYVFFVGATKEATSESTQSFLCIGS